MGVGPVTMAEIAGSGLGQGKPWRTCQPMDVRHGKETGPDLKPEGWKRVGERAAHAPPFGKERSKEGRSRYRGVEAMSRASLTSRSVSLIRSALSGPIRSRIFWPADKASSSGSANRK